MPYVKPDMFLKKSSEKKKNNKTNEPTVPIHKTHCPNPLPLAHLQARGGPNRPLSGGGTSLGISHNLQSQQMRGC